MIYQDDTITLQTSTATYDSIGVQTLTWATSASVKGDAQPYNKEKAFREYGLTAENEMKRIFTPANTAWVEGAQCVISSVSYRILKVLAWDNHYEVLVERVS